MNKDNEQLAYIARDLFLQRDKSQGDMGLHPVITAELGEITTATPELLMERYLYAGTYVRGLATGEENSYDQRDANYVNNKVRSAINARARELGIPTDHIA